MAKVIWKPGPWTQELEDKCERLLDRAAIESIRYMKQIMREPKTGRQKPPKKVKHWLTRRSAPGEAPAIQTGFLKASLQWRKNGRLTRIIGSTMNAYTYAFFLEFGTKRMAARPFVRPGLERAKEVLSIWLNRL